nr:hypothetical protein [Brevibacterium ravenspurgense]
MVCYFLRGALLRVLRKDPESRKPYADDEACPECRRCAQNVSQGLKQGVHAEKQRDAEGEKGGADGEEVQRLRSELDALLAYCQRDWNDESAQAEAVKECEADER